MNIIINYEGDLEITLMEFLLERTAGPREFRDCLKSGVLDDIVDLLELVKQHIKTNGMVIK